jgi:hypothetical protein
VTDIVWEKYIEATLLLWTKGHSFVEREVAEVSAEVEAMTEQISETAVSEVNPFASGRGLARTPPQTPKKTEARVGPLVPMRLCGGHAGGPPENKFGLTSSTTPQDKALVTTIHENEELLWRKLGVVAQRFRPSIPHLIYQVIYYFR